MILTDLIWGKELEYDDGNNLEDIDSSIDLETIDEYSLYETKKCCRREDYGL